MNERLWVHMTYAQAREVYREAYSVFISTGADRLSVSTRYQRDDFAHRKPRDGYRVVDGRNALICKVAWRGIVVARCKGNFLDNVHLRGLQFAATIIPLETPHDTV